MLGSVDQLCTPAHHLFSASWLVPKPVQPTAPRGCSEKHWGAKAEGLSQTGSSLTLVLGLSHCGQKCICGHGNDPSALALPGYFRI